MLVKLISKIYRETMNENYKSNLIYIIWEYYYIHDEWIVIL